MANYPVKPNYPYDDSGKALSNYIDGERHDLSPGRSRTLVMRAGPFYTDGYLLREYPSMRELKLGQDYEFNQPYEAAHLATGLEVAATVVIKDNSRTGTVVASYNLPGGRFAYYDAVIIEAVEQLINDNRNINFDELRNRPELYPPAFHMHNADLDIYGLDPLVESTDGIRDAIMLRNIDAILKPIEKTLESKVSRLGEHKVALRNCTYKDTSLGSETYAFVLRLPMTKTHGSDPKSCLAKVTISGAERSIDEFILEWHEKDVMSENGRDYHNISKVGRNNLPWKVAIISEYVDEVSLAFIIDDPDNDYAMQHANFCVTDYVIRDIAAPELLDTAKWESVSKANKSRFAGATVTVNPIIDETKFVNANRSVMLDLHDCFMRVSNSDKFGAFKFNIKHISPYFDFTCDFEIVFEEGSERIVSSYQVLGRCKDGVMQIYNAYLDGNAPTDMLVKISQDTNHLCFEAGAAKSGYVVLKSVTVPDTVASLIDSCQYLSQTVTANDSTAVKSEPKGNVRAQSNHKVSVENATYSPGNDNNLFLRLPPLKNDEYYKLTITVFDRLLTRQTVDSFNMMSDKSGNMYAYRVGSSESHGCHVRGYEENGYHLIEFAAVDSENTISHSTSHYVIESLVVFTNRPRAFEVPMQWSQKDHKDNSGGWTKPKDPSIPELKNQLLTTLAQHRSDIDALISDKASLSFADFTHIRSKRWGSEGNDVPRLDQMRSEINSAVQGKSVKVNYRVIPAYYKREGLSLQYRINLRPNTKYLFTNFTANSFWTDKNTTYTRNVFICDSHYRVMIKNASGPTVITVPADGVLIIQSEGYGSLNVARFAALEVA